MYRFGAGGDKTILKILCLFLKCDKNIVVRNTAYFDDLQKLSDRIIRQIRAMGIFSYKIVDVCDRRCGYKTVYFAFLA